MSLKGVSKLEGISDNQSLLQDQSGGYSPRNQDSGALGFRFYFVGLVGLALLSREDMTSIGCILSGGGLSVFIIDAYFMLKDKFKNINNLYILRKRKH